MLLALICLVLFIINCIALSRANRIQVYDDLKWAELVQSLPSYSCKTENRLNCAGYKLQQCQFDNNETSMSYCPGHFCVDFCKIATNDINPQELCAPCRANASSPTEFLTCKKHEKSVTASSSCKVPLNEDLRKAYQRLLGVATVCSLMTIITVIATSYQLCCV